MASLQSLIDMGATAAMAREALKRTKGDLMEAAELVFSGELDGVADDEPADEPTVGGDIQCFEGGLSVGRPSLPTPEPDDDGEDDSMDVDERQTSEQEDSEALVTEDEDDGEYPSDVDSYDEADFDIEAPGITGAEDPYSGIFFSTSRREELIEVLPLLSAADRDGAYEVLSFGEWMSGCPEKGEQDFLFNLWRDETEHPVVCSCGWKRERSPTDFFALLPTFPEYLAKIAGDVHLQCPSCSRRICLACGEDDVGNGGSFDAEGIDKGKGKDKATSAFGTDLFHCAKLQGALLGVGLIMVSRLFAQSWDVLDYSTPTAFLNAAEASGATDEAPKSKKRKTTTSTTPTASPSAYLTYGKGKAAPGGTGYSGAAVEDRSGQKKALELQQERDTKLARLLKQVRGFLPNLRRVGGGKTSDYLPHPTTLTNVRRRFNTVLSRLLKNDSLADMTTRSELYFEVLDWLFTLSNHDALSSGMAMPQMLRVSATPRVTQGTSTARERVVVYEGADSPRVALENVVIQATAAVKGMERTAAVPVEGEEAEEVPVDAEYEKVRDFCQRIIKTSEDIDRALTDQKGADFVKRLHASLPYIPRSSTVTAQRQDVETGATDEEIRRNYEAWAKGCRFEYCDLRVPQLAKSDKPVAYRHAFTSAAVALSGNNLPKRSLAIAKELATLATNIPVAFDGSILLRVDEERVDVIKALIIGPADTPYANGCFIFDIFLPMSYNTSPPKVKTMTTNGGTYRLNPNLYAEGKVCLSLLGTWSGPGWVVGTSTLLQVLISIQAMILNDEPYLNEPGWSSQAGTAASKAYSANVRRMVVADALLNSLKRPPYPFEDVIRTHFKLKSKVIQAQLDSWLAEDDGRRISGQNMGTYQEGGSLMASNVAELKQLLGKLERGESLDAADTALSTSTSAAAASDAAAAGDLDVD